MGSYVKKKKEMVFQSVDALQQVVNVVNEAAQAVNDKSKTISQSAIPEVLTGALGAGIGGVGSFFALYGLGTVGLSKHRFSESDRNVFLHICGRSAFQRYGSGDCRRRPKAERNALPHAGIRAFGLQRGTVALSSLLWHKKQ